MIRPAITIQELMRPLYADRKSVDKSAKCDACHGNGYCRRCLGTNWRLREQVEEPKSKKAGWANNAAKYSDDIVAEIRATQANTMPQWRQLAAKYGMSVSNVRKIIRGEGRR